MPESVKRRGSSGPTTGATVRSAVSLSSIAMRAEATAARPAEGQYPVSGRARDPARAGERDARHGGGLDRERDEVLRLEVVHVGLAARARERLRLERERAQVVRQPAAAQLGVEARRELVVLGRDPG